jgi:lipopolysaccharide export LptBFGC system permease protein LptF
MDPTSQPVNELTNQPGNWPFHCGEALAMKMLDRYILRNFLSSAALWFVAFMALRTVADLFINMDEFVKLGYPLGELLTYIVTYYSHQSLVYFTELGGIIIVASAAFTLAMMNHTNELTAMLASGVSLLRVIVPVVGCSVLLSGLIVLDREFLIPQVADQLVLDRDDVYGRHSVPVRLASDGTGCVWYATGYDPATGVMKDPIILVRDAAGGALARAMGTEANAAIADGRPGWALTGGVLSRLRADGQTWEHSPRWDAVYSTVDPAALSRVAEAAGERSGRLVEASVADPEYGMVLLADSFEPVPVARGEVREGTLRRPRFLFCDAGGKILGVFLARTATWQQVRGSPGHWALEEGRLFFPSDLSRDDLLLRRSSKWFQYMSTADLSRLLTLPNVPNRLQVLLTRHMRFTEPICNLVMLLLGLPFILARERNIKSSATLCLLMVGAFFIFIQICRHLDLTAALAAWMPVLLFGPLAAVMLDSVKT